MLLLALASSGDRTPQTTPAPQVGDVAFKSAQDFWHDWATQLKYKFVVSKDRRVLVMVPEERSKPEHTLDLVEKALQRADQVVPPLELDKNGTPNAAPATPTTGGASGSNGAAQDAPKSGDRWEWCAQDNPLDRDPIVFGLFRSPSEYSAALSFLGGQFPYLASWLEKGKRDPGCILERPLFGACVDKYPGMQEWNPDNEVVHRVAQLVVRRRFGQQPVWVGLGVGWNVEFDVLKTIYCFPWRDGFVSVHEHGGWEPQLAKTFTRRSKDPLEMRELAAITRGKFDVDDAAMAWGLVRYLTQFEPGKLSHVLSELHDLREKLGKKPNADGKGWTMSPDYDVPADEQKGAIERLVAADVLAQASDYFRVGRSWKKPATKSPK
jgi:hypothetical protein